MAWYLNPALTRFRKAVNEAYPTRDKASDGTIGDEAHQATSSDHNPDGDGSVDAWDMDVNLRSGGDDAAVIEHLKKVFQTHESSRYWIHNDQIASRSTGWKRESYAYAGPNRNRHTQHVHWNSRSSHENSTAPWEVDMPLSADDVAKVAAAAAKAVWDHKHPHPTRTGEQQSKGTVIQFMDAVHDAQTGRVLTAMQALGVELGEDVDEQAIVTGILAGLTPEIAAALPPDLAQKVVDVLLDRIAAAAQAQA